jgi:hypothetical protein
MGRPLNQNLDFGMTFNCEGQAFVVSDVEQSLYSANTETGRLTRIGELGSLGAPITDIAIWGDQAVGIGVGSPGANGAPAAPNLYSVDLEAATAELIGPLGGQAANYNNAGLSFDAAGVLWAITDRRAVAAAISPAKFCASIRATGAGRKGGRDPGRHRVAGHCAAGRLRPWRARRRRGRRLSGAITVTVGFDPARLPAGRDRPGPNPPGPVLINWTSVKSAFQVGLSWATSVRFSF